jgi:predicted dienelactone hydrolase
MHRATDRPLAPIAAVALLGALLGPLPTPAVSAAPYDPLAVADARLPPLIERQVDDRARKRRLPLRIYLPAAGDPAPVILFSHGLGGSNRGNAFLGEHWARRGFAVVFLQHPGSDVDVWQGLPVAQRRRALQRAADVENFLLRVGDVPTTLDALAEWNRTRGDALRGRLDLEHVGMSGHSFGALTTQAVSGQRFLRGQRDFTDPRIDAALMLSPNAPTRGGGGAVAFGAVRIPWLLMTGTRDTAPIGGATVASRLAVYPALPAGGRYELVLDRAEHSAFTDRALPGERERRNPNHHRAIVAISTAFWDACLRNDRAARRWLEGDDARSVLEPADRWKWK